MPGHHHGETTYFLVDEGFVAESRLDTAKEAFTYEELDSVLTPHYASRPPGETFAAAEVLALKKG